MARTPESATETGEPGASSFDSVYRGHVRAVARWAARLCGPTVDVEDVVQEVFVTVARRLPEFRGDAPIQAWLFRITHKTVANLRRRARVRRWLRLEPRAGEDIPASEPGPGELLERRQAEARFYRVLGTLPERQRDVLVLFELEGLSTLEIAALLAVQVGTVRVWLHRGRAAFLRSEEKLTRKESRGE